MDPKCAQLLKAAEGIILVLGAAPPDAVCNDALNRLKAAVLAVKPDSVSVYYNPVKIK